MGKNKLYVVHQQQHQRYQRYTTYLERSGQKQQISQKLKECPVPSDISTIVKISDGRKYKLAHVYSVNSGNFDKHRHMGGYQDNLYHGTRDYAAAYIMLQHFKLPIYPGAFGEAVYLAPDIQKSFSYTQYDRPVIIVCEAYLGRIQQMYTVDKSLNLENVKKKGFNTVFCKNIGVYPEYAVYDPTRIRIKYLLEYERMKQ